MQQTFFVPEELMMASCKTRGRQLFLRLLLTQIKMQWDRETCSCCISFSDLKECILEAYIVFLTARFFTVSLSTSVTPMNEIWSILYYIELSPSSHRWRWQQEPRVTIFNVWCATFEGALSEPTPESWNSSKSTRRNAGATYHFHTVHSKIKPVAWGAIQYA